jgi:thymidine kinase
MAKLYFYYSTMNAGKSTSLLQAAYNYAERDMKAVLFTYRPDGAPTGRIESRIGIGADATGFSSMTRFDLIVPSLEPDCVLIDEAQFFDDQIVSVCETLAAKGIRVIVAGLDMDYLGKPFGQMPQLLAVADFITKLHAICVKCGNLASISFRKTADASQILLGATDSYEPRCRKCYYET